MKKTMIAALLGATLLGGAAHASVQDGAARAPAARADTNGDGVLTRQEMLAAAEARFARMDTNRDGQVTREERRAARVALRGERGGHHRMGKAAMRGRMLERFDADKHGKLSDAERQAAKAQRAEFRQRMLERFDADKDGKLSPAERQAARAARPAND